MVQNRTGTRRAGERYYTPTDSALVLLRLFKFKVDGYIFEPCVGTGNIVEALRKSGFKDKIITNDIDLKVPAMMRRDASKLGIWQSLHSNSVINDPDWVITNPPFSLAWDVLQYAWHYCKSGVILFLPQTFTEPTLHKPVLAPGFTLHKDYWLYKNPPNGEITLPRVSFTGDGKQAPVTCSWFIWTKKSSDIFRIIVPRQEVKEILNDN